MIDANHHAGGDVIDVQAVELERAPDWRATARRALAVLVVCVAVVAITWAVAGERQGKGVVVALLLVVLGGLAADAVHERETPRWTRPRRTAPKAEVRPVRKRAA